MNDYWSIIKEAYSGYANYLWNDVISPGPQSFFWWVIIASLFFFGLELIKPWRKDQAKFRKDFWLDLFYMFFNFFLFGLIVWNAGQKVLVALFNDALASVGIENIVMVQLDKLPIWAYYLILFVAADFVSWWIHRLLHRVPIMWKWHKVHHSVEQMGFAAHMRYHWMENVVYWSLKYIPLTMLGADLVDIYAIYVLNMTWGHFNHSNITVNPRITGGIFGALVALAVGWLYVDSALGIAGMALGGALIGALILGPYMRILFNSPEMHIWHHAWDMPEDKPHGINFGLTLAIWDYIFGTAHVPYEGRDIRLGFPGLKSFPKKFLSQEFYGIVPQKEVSEGPEGVT